MSTATAITVAASLVPIRREGARPGPMHAASLEPDAWVTACGERLVTSSRGRIVRLSLREAWEIIDAGTAGICRRCARVGDSVDAPEV